MKLTYDDVNDFINKLNEKLTSIGCPEDHIDEASYKFFEQNGVSRTELDDVISFDVATVYNEQEKLMPAIEKIRKVINWRTNIFTTTRFIIEAYNDWQEMYQEVDSRFSEDEAKKAAKLLAWKHGEVRIVKETRTLKILGKMVSKSNQENQENNLQS